jgi:alkylresorcinol/alkylpyrone synthase
VSCPSPWQSARMTTIAAVAGALPAHRYPQGQITEAFGRVCVPDEGSRRLLERFHAAARVEYRHLAMPLERYGTLTGFGEANDTFIAVGAELGVRAIGEALGAAGLAASDVDVVMTVSVTGIAAPSLDARLHARLGLRTDVKRVPIFGLGCVAGAAGVARLHDYLQGHPDEVAVLLSVELCSLTVQRDDASMPNLVASGLFGDGAAAVVLVGARRARTLGLDGPAVVATRSRFYPDTERVMGWDVGGSGFRIVLSASVADVVEQYLGDDVRTFLEDHDLKTADIGRWVAHPGGPKVLEAMARALDLPDGALDVTWRSLAAVGNLSSSSVLHVLADTLAGPRPQPGTDGLLFAMGPGFCAEFVLLRW